MAELIIALAPLLGLMAIALVAIWVPLVYIGSFALSLMLTGFVFGLPSGIYYHVLLRRALLREGELPKGWYWRPQRYHGALDVAVQRPLQRWFLLGAAGFGLVMLGFLLAVLTLVLWLRAGNSVLP